MQCSMVIKHFKAIWISCILKSPFEIQLLFLNLFLVMLDFHSVTKPVLAMHLKEKTASNIVLVWSSIYAHINYEF